jgi:hypothetical protein
MSNLLRERIMRHPIPSFSFAASGKFVSQVGHDLVRMAAICDGLENWLVRHGGSIAAPGIATRKLAAEMYGESEEAAVLNTAMTFAIDKHVKGGVA